MEQLKRYISNDPRPHYVVMNELSDKTGISKSMLSHLKNGIKKFNVYHAVKLDLASGGKISAYQEFPEFMDLIKKILERKSEQ